MTTGQFASVEISSIQIIRSERTRRELRPEDIRSLADSIRDRGLIHPPLVTRDLVLIAGETRLEACRSLGWTSISVQYADTADPKELLALELEENVKRKDISWQDQAIALKRFHDLQKELHPDGWSTYKTAEAINLSQAFVSQHIAVAEELESGNERVISAPKFSVASGITSRVRERRAADELASLGTGLDKGSSSILTADFLSWVESYSGPSFNLIHCDFPYGIGADTFNQASADLRGGYDDTPETYFTLLETLCRNRDKLMGESGHLIFWFSMQHYSKTLDILNNYFRVESYPLVWHKSDNKGTLPDPTRGPRRVYEVAFFASHGDRKILQSVANTFSGPTVRSADHMSEKSQDMLEHFFRMVVDSKTRILDPTCGSGSAIRAAKRLGAEFFLGLEKNPDFASAAQKALKENV
jgi:ParB/RepB/Spo0J family partition protein